MALPERLQVILELKADQYKREVREVSSATGRISTSAKKAGSATGNMQTKVGKLGTATGKLNGTLSNFGPGLIAAFGAQKVISTISDAVGRAEDLNSIYAITDQVIEKTGGSANLTAEEIANLSKEQSLLTGVDKALVQEGNNVLLTFKNIRNEVGEGNQVFERTSALMLDVGAVMGTDARSGAIQLGKALNDPVANLGALSRAGLTFTEDQKEQIKSLVETGDLLEAQKLILGELESQLGGTAAASADMSDKLGNAGKEIQEQFGQVLLDVLEEIGPTLIELAPLVGDLAEEFTTITADTVGLITPLLDLLSLLSSLSGETEDGAESVSILSVAIDSLPFVGALGHIADMFRGTEDLTKAIDLTDVSAERVTRTFQDRFNPAVDEAGDGAEDTAEDLGTLHDQMRALVDPAFAAIDALGKYKDSQLALNEAVDEYTVNSAEAEEAGQDVLESYNDLVSAAQTYADVSGKDLITSIRELGEQAKVPREIIEALIADLHEVDGFVATATVRVNHTGRRVVPSGLEGIVGRQHGGPVRGLTQVGERNLPEVLAIPGDRGTVFSNQEMKDLIAAFRAAAGGGDRSTSFTFNNSQFANDPMQAVRSALAFDSMGNL